MSDLKPCPFCGGSVRYIAATEVSFPFFLCENGHAICLKELNEAEAIEAWNTRAERTCKCVYRDCGDGFGGHYCTACGEYMDASDRYCHSCGAKVMEQ